MPVPVLVDEIFGRDFSDRSKPLWAPRGHPDEIAGRDRIPRISEPVDTSTFEHDEAVFHHVYFNHTERGTGPVDHGIDREIEAHLVRQKTFDLQDGIISERVRGTEFFWGHNSTR